jgi:lambda family phage holin
MKMPEKDPGTWYALWATIPEPAKAAILNVLLGALMAFRNKERTFAGSILEVTVGGVLTFMAGSAVEAFGLSTGWCYAIGGAVAVFGVEKVKDFAAKVAERKAQ